MLSFLLDFFLFSFFKAVVYVVFALLGLVRVISKAKALLFFVCGGFCLCCKSKGLVSSQSIKHGNDWGSFLGSWPPVGLWGLLTGLRQVGGVPWQW